MFLAANLQEALSLRDEVLTHHSNLILTITPCADFTSQTLSYPRLWSDLLDGISISGNRDAAATHKAIQPD